MLMTFVTPAHVDLFTLVLMGDIRTPTEYLFFRKEKNLLALFPEAKWQGQAEPGAKATYTRSFVLPEDIAAMGAKVYENVYTEDL